MTEYTDIPQVNTLYQEQQRVQAALNYLTTGGSVINMTAAPPLGVAAVSVIIELKQPNTQQLLDEAVAALKVREGEINQELESLGITSTPVTTPVG